ncbi:MAG: 30S ribosomal protein S4e [Candidatus Bathyarchaeota archaeon]
MGSKGGSSHIKRLVAPSFWPIHRKEKVWTVKPSPGPHSISESIPLLVIVRDLLSLAKTAREASIIISGGKIKVDGRVRKDRKFPVGLMDVVEIPDIGKSFRVVPDSHNFLALVEVSGEEKNFKLCRIEGKVTVKGGKTQLNLHDGKNVVLDGEEAKKGWKVLDVLKIGFPDYKIVLQHLPLKEGMYAVITGGRNIGKHGVIKMIEKTEHKARKYRSITIEDTNGGQWQTIPEYVFVVGEEKPLVSLSSG